MEKGVNSCAAHPCRSTRDGITLCNRARLVEVESNTPMWEDVVLLLLNSHSDTIDLLTDWFGALGATVHHARTADLCAGLDQARAMVETIRPTVVLFDLAIPYERHWHCFQHIANAGVFGAVPIVLTTVNKDALESLVGPTHAFEIVGTPHDLRKRQDLVEWRLGGRARVARSSLLRDS
jgi:CheY-like chemotaxis protein